MRPAKVVMVVAAFAPLSLPVLAQEPLAAPPVLRITVEDIKPGNMGVHQRQVGSYLSLFSRAQVPMSRIGMTPITGDQNQVVYLEGYPSYAELEAADKKVEAAFAAAPAMQAELDALEKGNGPLHESQRAMIAVLRTDLSYRPMATSAFAKSRYLGLTTLRIKIGRIPDYEGWVKQLNRAREKASIDESTAFYQVTSGAPGGTFLVFSADRSLAEWDTARAGMEARNKAFEDAIGGEEVMRQRRATIEAILVDSRSALYALDPKISSPPAQIAAGDPDFWSPKPQGKALASKAEAPKTKATEAPKTQTEAAKQ
jgi:hypothetical protein